MTSQAQSLDQNVLQRPVRGRNLAGPTLADNLREPTLVVFLRHFG
jgi:hypothetical protein